MNDDGTVMRGPGVTNFAERHKLKQISIADLIAYRQARDKLEPISKLLRAVDPL
jgi:3,4-dihydroxy 2-butanone 4-phosphate synthase/GTP cyclohydrolase II